MRRFFFDLLSSLDKLTGMKQMEKLQATEHPEKEIGELLDVLCNTASLFPMIPEDAQKSILRHAVVSDGDFIGLNAKFVYKSLHAQKDRFIVEAAHVPRKEDPNWKPLEGEARQEKLTEWLRSLEGFNERIVTKSHVKVFEETLPPKDKGIIHHSSGVQEVLERELHIEYIKEMNKSGKPKEEWLPENEWRKTKL
jgi:hypothetical protein